MIEKEEKTLGQIVKERYGKMPTGESSIPVDSTKKDILQALTSDIRNDYVELDLPTKGLFYEEGQKIYIRPFSYDEEKMMMTASKAGSINLVDNLIRRCLQGIAVEELTIPDKVFILFKLRELSYGNEYKVNLMCEQCEHSNELVVEINKLNINYTPEDAQQLQEIHLPGCNRKAFVIIPRVKDEKYVTSPSLLMDNIWRFVERVEDIEDRDIIRSFIKKLPASDISILKQAIIGQDWGIDTLVKFHCLQCEAVNENSLPLNADFFSVNSGD